MDGITLNALVKELNDRLSGRTVKKIFMPADSRFYMVFGKDNLLISLNSASNYICISEGRDQNEDFPSAFVMLLRKYLKNTPLICVRQTGLDRIIEFKFKGRNEFGDDKHYNLFVELMGRNSNMILTEEDNRILDAYRRKVNDFRSVLPGAFLSQCKDKKFDILNDDIDRISETVVNSELGAFKTLSETLQGFSKKHIEEIMNRLDVDKNDIVGKKGCGNKKIETVSEVIRKIKNEIENSRELYIFSSKTGNLLEISPLALTKYDLNDCEVAKHTPSKAVEIFHSGIKREFDINAFKDPYMKIIVREIKKTEANLENMREDFSETSEIEILQKEAELLVGNIYKFDPNSRRDFVEVENWENGEKTIIKLDNLFSVSRNVQMRFRKVAKLKRRMEITGKRISKFEEYLFYLNQLYLSLINCDDKSDLQDIVDEMQSQNLITVKRNNKGIKKKKEKEVSSPREFEFEGYRIFVGKNNIQNDKLTKESKDNDIWLHTQKIPGSHVVIKSEGRQIGEKIVLRAARYAAAYSKASQSSNVPVDYTEVKNVWKPKGAKPGLVLYKNFKTFYVNPFRTEENI